MTVLSIDPGSQESAYTVIDAQTYRPMKIGKVDNQTLRCRLMGHVMATAVDPEIPVDAVVIERIACYGLPVGREVFDTCQWIGRFTEIASQSTRVKVDYILRQDQKLNLCHSVNARDSTIRRALIYRFAGHDQVNGRGTKADPDWFWGFHSDIWAAYAVGVTYIDRLKEHDYVGEEIQMLRLSE